MNAPTPKPSVSVPPAESDPPCPACRHTSHVLVEQYHGYEIRRCSACGLSFSSPMRAGDEDFYQRHLVYAHPTVDIARQHYRSARKKSNRRLLRLLPPGSRLLDVGCGFGGFVKLAVDLGMDAYGIDMNREGIAVGREAFGLGDRLIVGRIEDLADRQNNGRGSFDLVTLFEVIEHVESPQGLIDQCRTLLREGGLLCATCPNEARWEPFGRLWVDYPPHHLTRWRPDTLRSFLASNGFEFIMNSVESSLRDVVWAAWVNRSARARLGGRGDSGSVTPRRQGGIRKLRRGVLMTADRMLRLVCAPADMTLRAARIGTLGQRVLMRKAA